MQADLKIITIVLNTTSVLNLNTIDKYFFIENKIIKAEEIISDKSFFSTQFVLVVTKDITIQINTLQLIITSLNPIVNSTTLSDIATKIIEFGKIEGTINFGINFNWFLSDELEKSIPTLTRKLFYNENNLIQNTFFNEDNSSFGFYSSKNVLNTRLKLNVQPIKYAEVGKEEIEAIQLGFNYHKDFKIGQDTKELLSILSNFNAYEKDSKTVVSTLA